MESKHTPGPWSAKDYRVCALEPFAYICDTANNKATRTPENAANARLIAAAPDILAAAVRAERELSRLSKELGDWDSSEQKTLEDLRAAILKAKGGA